MKNSIVIQLVNGNLTRVDDWSDVCLRPDGCTCVFINNDDTKFIALFSNLTQDKRHKCFEQFVVEFLEAIRVVCSEQQAAYLISEQEIIDQIEGESDERDSSESDSDTATV